MITLASAVVQTDQLEPRDELKSKRGESSAFVEHWEMDGLD